MEDILRKGKMQYGLISIMLLNIFDGIATFIGLKYKFYKELNTFLRIAYEINPLLFLLIKVILPTILVILLLNKISNDLSNITKLVIFFSNIIYVGICVYHIVLYLIFILN